MAKVLFVDDEKMILNSLKRGLRKLDYEFYYVDSGKEALRLLEHVDIDVIFSDMKMPEMSGLELLKRIQEKYPDMVKVIVSGYAQLPQLIATINQTDIYKYIAKPFDLYGELVPIVREAVEYAEFTRLNRQRKDMLESKNQAYRNMLNNMKSKTSTKEQSYDLIRIYQQVIFNNIKDMIKDDALDKERRLSIMNLYKRFAENYLQEIKKNEIYIEPKRIMDEVAYMLKRDGYRITIEKGVHDSSKVLYQGRGCHLKPIVLSIIEDTIETSQIGTIKLISTENSRSEDQAEIGFVIEFNKRLVSFMDAEWFNLKFYKSLLNVFGGNLNIFVKEQVVNVVLTAMLYYSEEGEEDELLNR